MAEAINRGRELTAEQVLAAIYNCKLDHCRQCKYLLHGEACMDELLDEGTAAGINYGLVLLADEIGVLHVVQRMLNTHLGAIKEDEKNETGN